MLNYWDEFKGQHTLLTVASSYPISVLEEFCKLNELRAIAAMIVKKTGEREQANDRPYPIIRT